MTITELDDILSLSRAHSYCVDVRPVPEAPGYVRTLTLYAGNRVNLEFDIWGMDEGGLYYWASFDSLSEMIRCVEDYLTRPIAEWRCLGPVEYPAPPSQTERDNSHRKFQQLLGAGGPTLPASGEFQTGSTYWLKFMPERVAATRAIKATRTIDSGEQTDKASE
jgi:hypothetical protein